MNPGLLQTALLSAAESCLNRLLALDAASGPRLQKLAGRSLRVECTFPPLAFNLLVNDGTLMLLQGEDRGATATVRGSAAALVKLLVTKDISSARAAGINIQGDTGFLADLQAVLTDLDVDWEYQLSRIIGDIPTQAVSDTIAGTEKFARQTAGNLRDDLDAWLHEEKRLFPDRTELEGFYRAVDQLRLRTDRLEARVKRL